MNNEAPQEGHMGENLYPSVTVKVGNYLLILHRGALMVVTLHLSLSLSLSALSLDFVVFV